MGRVIFLLEEPSMKAFLLEYLPRLVPGWVQFQDFLLVPHEGKTDLDKSFPNKLKNWREPDARFVIVRDNDGGDCIGLKERIRERCDKLHRDVTIRLICQELESWYLGDLHTLENAYPTNRTALRRLVKRYSDPDSCRKPSNELEHFVPSFQKQDAARKFGRLLCYQNNSSKSLRVFSQGVEGLIMTSKAASLHTSRNEE